MPLPPLQDVHVNRPLTDISVAFEQSLTNYVSQAVFPVVQTAKKSDLYFKYDKSDWLRSEASERAPGEESAGSGWRQTTDSYLARVFAIHKDIDEQIRANQDSPLDLDRDAARWCTQQIMIKRDKEWADAYFTTGVWDVDLVGAVDFTQWDAGGSTPIDDITNEMFNISCKTGFRPNVAVCGAQVFNTLRNHPDVLDRIKFSERGIITEDLLAAILGVDRFVVAWAVEETAAEGATSAVDCIFGKNFMVAYAPPSPSILHPSAGYQFVWTGLVGAGETGMRTKSMELPWLNSTRVECELALDMKPVSTDLASFFSAAIS